MKALVVDGSRAMHKVIGGILHKKSFEVPEAADRGEILDLLRNPEPSKVDSATISQNMPAMNGLELMVNVRVEKSLCNITLMVVTTESEYSRIVRALAASAYEYLIEPFIQEVISEKLLLLGLGS